MEWITLNPGWKLKGELLKNSRGIEREAADVRDDTAKYFADTS